MAAGNYCRYHCHACGSHFASLEAFDAHRDGPPTDRTCSFPDLPAAVELVELNGTCKISGRPTLIGATVYALIRPGKFAAEGRETAEGSARRAAA